MGNLTSKCMGIVNAVFLSSSESKRKIVILATPIKTKLTPSVI